ncbi:MAG: hypothetical protein Q9174_007395, partial [Haloplaca sp. 1 TL-2023]
IDLQLTKAPHRQRLAALIINTMEGRKELPIRGTNPASRSFNNEKKEDPHSHNGPFHLPHGSIHPSNWRDYNGALSNNPRLHAENIKNASTPGEIYKIWLLVDEIMFRAGAQIVLGERGAFRELGYECQRRLQQLIEGADTSQFVVFLRDFCTGRWRTRETEEIVIVISLLHAKFKDPGFMVALWQDKSFETLLDDRELRRKLDLIVISTFMEHDDDEEAVYEFVRDLDERRRSHERRFLNSRNSTEPMEVTATDDH